ncbi:hypothetical protein A0H81_06600 [Grifola frondosa]|uniref:Uncharacterized protein n=1 Tax=Grifola frondosa TaxID=5627 RepID=A0A1C7M9A0_GRIFR|nr:hypothetical protein A0H81_06600 [Grifola frondosa]
MRMLKQKILEQEQAAEDREALKMTEEQRDMLIDSFRAVKMEFNDLDGLSWSAALGPSPPPAMAAVLSAVHPPQPPPRAMPNALPRSRTQLPPSRHRHTTPVDPSFFLLDDQTSDPAELDTPCPSPKTRRTLAAPPLPTAPNIPPAPPTPNTTPAHADDNNLQPAALSDDSAPSSKAYPVLDTCLSQHVLAELPIPPPLVRTSCVRIPSSESLAHRKTSPAGARKVSPAAARKTPPSTLRRTPPSPSARRASPAGTRNLSRLCSPTCRWCCGRRPRTCVLSRATARWLARRALCRWDGRRRCKRTVMLAVDAVEWRASCCVL